MAIYRLDLLYYIDFLTKSQHLIAQRNSIQFSVKLLSQAMPKNSFDIDGTYLEFTIYWT